MECASRATLPICGIGECAPCMIHSMLFAFCHKDSTVFSSCNQQNQTHECPPQLLDLFQNAPRMRLGMRLIDVHDIIMPGRNSTKSTGKLPQSSKRKEATGEEGS